MAIGLVKKNTLIALKEEVTEGVPLDPTEGDDFIEVLEDGLEVIPSKELVERAILVPSLGQITPRTSTRGVTAAFPVEWRAGGAEGVEPDYFVLLDSMLGGKNTRTASISDSDAAGTTTSFNQTATALVKGDFIVIEDASTPSWHSAFVTDVTADLVTFGPPAPQVVADATAISASVTYFPINSGQITFTGTVYWADEIKESAAGCRVSAMGLENFTTGQIPSLAFGCEGLTSDRVDGSAAFTPITSDNAPPVALGAVVQQGDVCIDLNEISISLENVLSFLSSVKSNDGKISSRFVQRTLSGTMNPYLDDSTTENFWDKFLSDEPFSIFITLSIDDPDNAGQFIPGSNVGMYLPQVLLTEDAIGDVDQLLVEDLAFIPNAGQSGTELDITMGFS